MPELWGKFDWSRKSKNLKTIEFMELGSEEFEKLGGWYMPEKGNTGAGARSCEKAEALNI